MILPREFGVRLRRLGIQLDLFPVTPFLIAFVVLLSILSFCRCTLAQSESPTSTELPVSDSIEPENPKPDFKIMRRENDGSKPFDLSFDDLAFEMEKGEKFRRSMLTPEINNYNGATIKLRGYIRPSFSQSGLTKFIFVRDNKECCFGPGAALYDCVLVKLADGKKTDYTVRPVTIEGKFYLKEYEGPDGKVWSIYRMKNSQIK